MHSAVQIKLLHCLWWKTHRYLHRVELFFSYFPRIREKCVRWPGVILAQSPRKGTEQCNRQLVASAGRSPKDISPAGVRVPRRSRQLIKPYAFSTLLSVTPMSSSPVSTPIARRGDCLTASFLRVGRNRYG